MKKQALFFFTLSLMLALIPKVLSQYQYFISPDYQNFVRIPVNIESKLSVTVCSSTDGQPVAGIPVTIKPQWSASFVKYSDTNGKVEFTVNPSCSGNMTIIYSSSEGWFATITTYVNALPAALVSAKYDDVQYMDPVGGEDIIMNLTVKDSETLSIVSNPKWDINVKTEGLTVNPTIIQSISVVSNVYVLKLSVSPRSISTIGTYYITVQASSGNLLPLPFTFKVLLREPAIMLHYKFATGEEISLAPHESGSGMEVKKDCSYFDIYFYDSKGRPLIVNFIYGTDMLTIVGQAGGSPYTIKAGDISYKWYTDDVESEGQGNKLRVFFTLTETYYHITPHVQAGIGGYLTTSEIELIVATVKTGFDIWTFITNPYFFIVFIILGLFIVTRITGRKKKGG